MTDLEILKQLYKNLQNSDSPLCDPAMLAFYDKLIGMVPEDGFDLQLTCRDLTETEEWALTLLNMHKYVENGLCHHTGDGYYYYDVNLRGRRFMELASSQVQSVVVGMQDSGKRETFASGAVRDSAEGKPRPDLLSAFALERIGDWLMLGSLKYAENNWMAGMNYSRVAASLHRHLMKYMQNDRSEDHLAAIVVNASFLMHYDTMIERGVLPASLNDLPKYNTIPPKNAGGNGES